MLISCCYVTNCWALYLPALQGRRLNVRPRTSQGPSPGASRRGPYLGALGKNPLPPSASVGADLVAGSCGTEVPFPCFRSADDAHVPSVSRPVTVCCVFSPGITLTSPSPTSQKHSLLVKGLCDPTGLTLRISLFVNAKTTD